MAFSTEQPTLPSPISPTQAALRDTLVGNTSVLAVQQLGPPLCQLVDGQWRWLVSAGLSLDIQVAESGIITHVELTQ